MQKKFFMLFVFLFLLFVSAFSVPFYIVTFDFQEAILQQVGKLKQIMDSKNIGKDDISLCLGGFYRNDLFSLYSQTSESGKVYSTILGALNADAVLPSSYDLKYSDNDLKNLIGLKYKTIVSDYEKSGVFDSYFLKTASDKKIAIFNISSVPSSWYETVSSKTDLFSFDLLVFFMDDPDLRIVPQDLRSRAIALSRKTAVYSIDLEYGFLVNEIKIPVEPSLLFTELSEGFERWKESSFETDPGGYQKFSEIFFLRQLGLLSLKKSEFDLMLFLYKDLPQQVTPTMAYEYYKDYIFASVTLPGANIRKMLENYASGFNFDGLYVTQKEDLQNLALFGEPYYIDMTRESGNRVIIKNFSDTQRVLLAGKAEVLRKEFPQINVFEKSPIFNIFWALKAGDVKISPEWRFVTLPYLVDYFLEEGDTILSIAKKFGISQRMIEVFNPGLLDFYLVPGQKFLIHTPYDIKESLEP